MGCGVPSRSSEGLKRHTQLFPKFLKSDEIMTRLLPESRQKMSDLTQDFFWWKVTYESPTYPKFSFLAQKHHQMLMFAWNFSPMLNLFGSLFICPTTSYLVAEYGTNTIPPIPSLHRYIFRHHHFIFGSGIWYQYPSLHYIFRYHRFIFGNGIWYQYRLFQSSCWQLVR